jgi:magnesium and cobalt exporter, CNNM family
MALSITITIAAVIALLLTSAFFSSSETALTAVSRARIHALQQDGNSRADLVARLIQTRDRLIGAILLGNNLANIAGSALATSLFLTLFGRAGVVYATIVMTALVLVFAEVLPKTIALTNPERFALSFSPLVRVFVTLFSPITAALQFTVRLLLRLFRVGAGDDADFLSAREELRGAIELHHKEGSVVKLDRDMLGGVLDLRELSVEDIMVHRTNMDMIDADLPIEKIIDAALSSPHTRIPLWQGKPEDIVGILHAKTLLRAVHEAHGDSSKIDPVALAAPPWFVPDTTSLKDQLNAFLKRKSHFAIVVDEYGEVMGLVTLEDIIEEIVGDITDETDLATVEARPQADGSLIVEGSVPIRDVNRLMEWDIPDDEATTIAGIVIHEAQAIPNAGQAFTFHGYRFEVLRRQRNRITLLRVAPITDADDDEKKNGA